MRRQGAHGKTWLTISGKFTGEIPLATQGERRQIAAGCLAKSEGQNGQKKKPSQSWTSFAASRTPLRVDAEAPRQATHLHSSANVRQCQGEKETFSLRAGMAALIAATPASRGLRRPASISAKRKDARPACAFSPGELRSSGGRSPQPQATRSSLPQRGREAGMRWGEPKGQHSSGKERKHALIQPPLRAGTARKQNLFAWGPMRPQAKRFYGPASGADRAPKRGHNRPRKRHSTTEGTTRKMTEELTQARGAQPPQHPSQGHLPIWQVLVLALTWVL